MTANGLVFAGAAAVGRGEYAPAEGHLEEGVALATVWSQGHIQAICMGWLAELARLRGDGVEARARFGDVLGQARTLGAPLPLAQAQLGLGRVLLAQGDALAAQPLLEEAVAVAGQAGLTHLVTAALTALGEVDLAGGGAAAARARFDEALSRARQYGDQAATAGAMYHLAELARAEGALVDAGSLHHEALSLRHQIGHRAGVADSLEALAGLNVAQGNHDVAARLFGAGIALREAVGCARPPGAQATYDADLAELRKGMAADICEQAWAEGASLGDEEAVTYAARGRGPRSRAEKGPESLTRTQRDIVALVAEGLSNLDIGERLFMSPRTVQSHLRGAYVKLGVTSRRQLRQALSGGA